MKSLLALLLLFCIAAQGYSLPVEKSPVKIKIGFITGHGEIDLSVMKKLKSIAGFKYSLQSVSLMRDNISPDEFPVLIIMKPEQAFTENELFKLDQYTMKGGHSAWLINKIIPNFDNDIVTGEIIDLNLNSFFESYGFTVDDNLVRDMRCASISVESSTGKNISVMYPYFPMIENIERSIPEFANIENVELRFVSTVSPSSSAGNDLKARVLLSSSPSTGIEDENLILNIEQFQNMSKADLQKLFPLDERTVGVILSGRFKSYFAGKTLPKNAGAGVLYESQNNPIILVIGDGDFANEESRPPEANIDFLAAIIDYLAN